jgi:hypothetical protein
MRGNSASEFATITRPLPLPMRARGLAERIWQHFSVIIATLAGRWRERALEKSERCLPPAAPPYSPLHSDVMRAETRRLL